MHATSHSMRKIALLYNLSSVDDRCAVSNSPPILINNTCLSIHMLLALFPVASPPQSCMYATVTTRVYVVASSLFSVVPHGCIHVSHDHMHMR